MTLIQEFKARFPEIDSTSVDSTFPLIADSWSFYYGGDYAVIKDKEIILNLLAHLFVIETSPGSGAFRLTASKAVGSVSASYAKATASGNRESFFLSTKYGQRFIMLTDNHLGTRWV